MSIDEVIEIEKSEHLKCENELESEMPMYQIKLCRKLIKEKGNYHKQIAEWLEELKSYRQYIDLTEIPKQYKLGFQDGIIAGNNKAIDDFVKALHEKIEKDLANHDLALECKKCGIWKNYDIKEIAEQLKAGGK